MPTITVDQARRARRELKLTQAALADASGLKASSIKLFETYRYKPGPEFLATLAQYFESEGVDLSDGDQSKAPTPQRLARAERPCFFISEEVDQEVADRAIDKMIEIDDAVDKLMTESVASGLLGGYSSETENRLRGVFKLMATGYLMFRLLQGMPPLRAVPNQEVTGTISDVLAQLTGADLAEVTGESAAVTEEGRAS